MRYTITSQQFDFLRKEGWVYFENLYPEDQTKVLQKLLSEESKNQPSGRDFERTNAPLKQALNLSMLGQIASQFSKKTRIKLAFTQYNPSYSHSILQEITSVSEVFGALLIDLNEGSGTFYTPETLIVFKKPSLLIAFATEKGRYVINKNDPHTHLLKKLGYSSGDLLTKETHPLIAK